MLADKSFIVRLIIFLIINFGALALGGLLQGKGSFTGWYAELNKAPWTPPGWVFGAAWFSIMICFSFFMAKLTVFENGWIWGLFVLQFMLNVSWNPFFFRLHMVILALIVIISLTLLISIFLFGFWKQIGAFSLLVLPYFIWLCIATSLNAYIYLNNPPAV